MLTDADVCRELPPHDLAQLLQKVRLMPKEGVDSAWKDHGFLLEVATAYHERRISQVC
jgi:hypothetical protein